MGACEGDGTFSDRYEEAASALGNARASITVGSCLYLVLNSASGDLTDDAVARRQPFLCDCLRLFAGAETESGTFHALSTGSLSTLPPSMVEALTADPDVVKTIIEFVLASADNEAGGADSSGANNNNDAGDRSDAKNRSVAAHLAASCLHAVDLRAMVSLSGDVRQTLVGTAAKFHLLSSYPLIELVLLFLLRLRRAALSMKGGGESSSKSKAKGFVRIIDSALFPHVRKRLLQLSSFLVVGNGSNRRGGGESAVTFPDWVRECIVAAQEDSESACGVSSYGVNGLYRPAEDASGAEVLGTRIAEVKWIDVSNGGLSFFAIQKASHRRNDGVDMLSPESCYAGRTAIYIGFEDLKKSGEDEDQQFAPKISFSMDDAAITLDLSLDWWNQNPCLAMEHSVGRPSMASLISVGSSKIVDLQGGEEAPVERQKNALKIFVKRDAFLDFLMSLRKGGAFLSSTDDDSSLVTSPGRPRTTTQKKQKQPAGGGEQDVTRTRAIELCTKDVVGLIAPSVNNVRSMEQNRAVLNADKESADASVAHSFGNGSSNSGHDHRRKRLAETSVNEGNSQEQETPSPPKPTKRPRKEAENTEGVSSAAEVTPLALNRAPGKDAVQLADANPPGSPPMGPAIDTPRISRLRSGAAGLQSLSALCFAASDDAAGEPRIAAADSTRAEDTAELVLGIDAALANAADAMNTLGRLAGRLAAIKGGGVSGDVVNSLSWVHDAQAEVRARNGAWLARRERVEEQLSKRLLESFTK
mmetsp:Transcript_33766/g.100750  ORF Transcript_33766/g.100750 Transcript_33766/m.100750 type:complete len:757 (-) Transcript_33766:2297-4567(-)